MVLCVETKGNYQTDSIQVYIEVTENSTTLSNRLAAEVQNTLYVTPGFHASFAFELQNDTKII